VTSEGLRILSYPSGKTAGTLLTGKHDLDIVTANPSTGDVLVNVGATIYDSHGGQKPIAQIPTPPGMMPVAFAFDITSSAIAVTYQRITTGYVYVYASPSSTPTVYSVPSMAYTGFIGYDDQGNLFVDGKTTSASPVFAELVKGTGGFINLTLDQSLTNMGSVQWDGSYITVTNGASINELEIAGSSAHVVSRIALDGAWARHPTSWIQDGTVLMAHQSNGHTHSGRALGYWSYPNGGAAFKVLNDIVANKHTWIISEAVSQAANEPQ
jgi:hypothetical protein